ncbi:uncharacterized protein [Solanum tuberosum]|uniref:Type I MADS box transcription factor n=1 Tax=Solanum tuberosum TaxID=4113 RepID=M1A5T3_SOLTU|nr:PREDICTED: uncharacterized protein LOC107063222 [Solanum tuberosum]
MPRKRARLTTSDLDEEKRKKMLDEKLESLCKKAYELSILCDVKVGIICSIPQKPDVFTWPSLIEAQNIVNDYLGFPEHKLVTHNDYLKPIVKNREKYIRKLEEIAEEKEMKNLFNELFEGKELFNVREIKGLLKLIVAKRVQLEQRKIQLNEVVANDNNVGEENVGHP